MAPPVRERRPPASSPGGGRHRGPTGRDRRVDRCPDGATPHSATLCGDPCPVCAMGDGSTAPFARLRRGGADRRSAFPCLAALLLNQHCAARPASRGGTDRRSPFPCLRVAPPVAWAPRRAPSRNCTFMRGGVCGRTRSWAFLPVGASALPPLRPRAASSLGRRVWVEGINSFWGGAVSPSRSNLRTERQKPRRPRPERAADGA